MSVIIDYGRDSLFSEFSLKTLKSGYMLQGENSPQDAFARAATAYSTDVDHAQRIYDYASKHWFMFASPILSNGGTERGLGISCFLNYIPDSIDGLLSTWGETARLTINGGGIGLYSGALRSDGEATSKGSASNGSIPFLKTWDAQMRAYSQGGTRRGAAAVYQDISHPEIEEFIESRRPTGDKDRRFSELHLAINITDDFMVAVKEGRPWNLIDPHTKGVKKVVDARNLWIQILTARMETGEPYIHFIDTTNKNLPEEQRDLGLRVNQSNLCSEITLPTNAFRTAVCCLSSINLEKYDEWIHDKRFIPDLIEFLDNVLSDFISKASKISGFERAVHSAMQERSIGLGAMGFHSFLQSKNIPFESVMAKSWNNKLFSYIKTQAQEATINLALKRGSCPDANGKVRRNMHLLAIAPNATSAIICGKVSPGIEPIPSNYYMEKTKVGSFAVRNKHLDKLLREVYKDNVEAIWETILNNHGSVSHLQELSDMEKAVFKTAFEIDQQWLIEHAADRQKYICQSQSLNLFLMANTTKEYVHKLHYSAWEQGVKTLYYLRTTKLRGAEKINQFKEDCLSCQG